MIIIAWCFCSISRERNRNLCLRPYRRSKKVRIHTFTPLFLSITIIYIWILDILYMYFFFFPLFIVNAELMLLGFISLLLVVFQARISKFCISEELASKWLPCKKTTSDSSTSTAHFQTFFNSFIPGPARRLLAEASASTVSNGYCTAEVLQLLLYFFFPPFFLQFVLQCFHRSMLFGSHWLANFMH